MKTCTRCKTVKDFEAFYRRGLNYQAWCKQCLKDYAHKRVFPKTEEKQCGSCGLILATSEFYPHKYGKHGLASDCKSCVKDKQYKRQYGLSPEEYKNMLSQGCEVCGDKDNRIVIDHCHTTNKVRGALCNNCNTALGLLGEDPLRMHNLANYIIRKTLTD